MNVPAYIDMGNPIDVIGWDTMLPVEIALRTAPLKEICAAYGVDRARFMELCANPAFVAELEAARELVAKEGASFKLKARMQADELLKKSWQMIHDQTTPAVVKADLIKSTVRWGGLEQDPKGRGDQGSGNNLNIQINLGG